MRGQKVKVRSERPKVGGNLGQEHGSTVGYGAILTGVHVPVAAHGGWAPRGLREAVGPLWARAAGTSAFPFRSLLADSARGWSRRNNTPGQLTTASRQPGTR